MQSRITLARRIRYAFDNLMGRGPVALIGLLVALTLGLIFLISIAMVALGVAPGDADQPLEFAEAAWLAMVRTLDAGTFGQDAGWRYRLLMLVDTLGGVFIVAALIGILSTSIDGRLVELRKGRSLVIEEGHTLILGWSPKIFKILWELAIANQSVRRPRVVIVAPRDKIEMEDEIRHRVTNLGKMKVICRTGNPIDTSDIQIGRPLSSKSIIVLSPESEDPDAQVIKTLLALTQRIRGEDRPRLRIIAEMQDERNLQAAALLGGGEVRFVLPSDIIARIAAQTCRQSGLSVVITELLDFEGSEFYFHAHPALEGKTFDEAARLYPACVLCGIQRASGGLEINPSSDTRFEQGDRALVIAEDDSLIQVTEPSGAIDESAIRSAGPAVRHPERTLILGWNRRGARLISELNSYAAPTSIIDVMADDPATADTITRKFAGLSNSAVTAKAVDTTDRDALDALNIPGYNHVILLCADNIAAQRADARALVTLLHLRDIAARTGAGFSITSEMLDIRDRDLAAIARADDFVVSDELTSLLVVQLSENFEIAPAFDELFTAEGSEVYIRPAVDYVASGIPVSFDTVAESARRQGQIAIGYRLDALANDESRAYGVVINPRKDDKLAFSDRDRVVVIAQD